MSNDIRLVTHIFIGETNFDTFRIPPNIDEFFIFTILYESKIIRLQTDVLDVHPYILLIIPWAELK